MRDGSLERGREAAAAKQCVGVLLDRLSQPGVVAVSLPELTLEGQPAGGLCTGGRGLDEHRLARSAQAGDGPVRVKRMAVGDERVELGERPLPPREIRGQDAVAGPEWVRRLFVRHETTPEVEIGRTCARPIAVHQMTTRSRQAASTPTRNQLRGRAAFWTTSR